MYYYLLPPHYSVDANICHLEWPWMAILR